MPVDFILLGAEYGLQPLSPCPERIIFWLRRALLYAPWVRTVFYVSNNVLPVLEAEVRAKVVCISPHEFLSDWRDESKNRHAVQLNLHRIRNLADRFVVFGEDQVLTHPAKPRDWFRWGLPVDVPRLGLVVATMEELENSCVALNDTAAVSVRFGFRRFILPKAWKWFFPWNVGCKVAFNNLILAVWGNVCPGFKPVNSPVPLLKVTMENVWAAIPDLLKETTERTIPSTRDFSLQLFRFWQFASGTFCPCRPCLSKLRIH